MKDMGERMERLQDGEKPVEAFSRLRDTGGAKAVQKREKVPQGRIAADPVVNELMIRRIMAALTSVE